MYARSLQPPETSFFLFGARGTGKTTWLRHHFPHAKWINLLDEALFQRLLVAPGEFWNELRTLEPHSWVVVDEVQRLPNLLNEVHRAIEELRLNFALTGSSARKLKRAGVNLLAGRARYRTMLPFLPDELGPAFDADRILRSGSIPLIWNDNDPEDALRSYVQMYIKHEIQAEALVRNLAGFARSLPVIALYNGQILNVASLARDAEVERKTAEGYLEILEDTLLVKRVYPYQARITVREHKKPKLYWVDPGIVRSIKGLRGPVAPEEQGSLFESYVFNCIRNTIENQRLYDEVFYWAPAQGALEVDFLLKRGSELTAIEVKSSKHIRSEHLRGLHAIQKLKELKRSAVVYLGSTYQRTDEGIDILPVHLLENWLREA